MEGKYYKVKNKDQWLLSNGQTTFKLNTKQRRNALASNLFLVSKQNTYLTSLYEIAPNQSTQIETLEGYYNGDISGKRYSFYFKKNVCIVTLRGENKKQVLKSNSTWYKGITHNITKK